MICKHLQAKLEVLTFDEQDAIMEFIDTLTDGDVIEIARGMMMGRDEIKTLRKAIEKFQGE